MQTAQRGAGLLLPCTGQERRRWRLTSCMHSASMNSKADRISPSIPLQVLKVCRTSAKPGQPAGGTVLQPHASPGPCPGPPVPCKACRQAGLEQGRSRGMCRCPPAGTSGHRRRGQRLAEGPTRGGKGEEAGLGKLRTGQKQPPLETACFPWTKAALRFCRSFKTFTGTERSLWCPGRVLAPPHGGKRTEWTAAGGKDPEGSGEGQEWEVTELSGRVSQREGPRTAEA